MQSMGQLEFGTFGKAKDISLHALLFYIDFIYESLVIFIYEAVAI
jgi:hypothetical protein